jgi:hypothetical protein
MKLKKQQKNEEEVKRRMNRKVLAAIIALVTSMTFVAVAPAFAKNLNLPAGADRIGYFCGGENVIIDLPTPLPTNYPVTATKISFTFTHGETPNAGIDFSSLLIQFYMTIPSNPVPHWEPFAHIVTNGYTSPEFLTTLYNGLFIELDATLFGLPEVFNLDNVIVVPEEALQVERDGNSIYVNLNTPQQIDNDIYSPTPIPNAYFTLYPLTVELHGYGSSIQRTSTISFSGYPGASGYTLISENIGFKANGVFTSPGLIPDELVVNDATITMHGTHTFYPPT